MRKIDTKTVFKIIFSGLMLNVLNAHNVMAVTYNDDMTPSIFNANSQQRCLDCHHSSLAAGAPRSFATLNVDYNTYSRATQDNGASGFVHVRTNQRANIDGNMPPTGSSLNSTERALIGSWIADGAPLSAATAVTDPATSIAKTTANLRGDFDTNVHTNTTVPGSYHFSWGLTTSYGSNTSSTVRSSTSTAFNQSHAISGLSCGTTYNFRGRATNGHGTGSGSNRSFTTSACTAPVITEGASVSPVTNEDTDLTLTLNRSDDDPGTLTWSVQTQGSKGTFSFDTSTTGSPVTVRYSPTSNQNGSDTAGRIRITNSTTGLTDTITVNMSITAVNDAPSITSSAVTTATEDVTYSYFVTESDPDDGGYGAGLTISLSNEPTGMVVNSTTGEITWTPANGVTTSGLVTVTVTDGGENSALPATQMFTVAVTVVNDPPVITSTAGTTATEDVPYSYQVLLTDVDDTNDGTNISFNLSGAPFGMAVSNTGLITWTPLEGVTTSGAVTVTVEDGNEDGSTPTIGNNGQELFTVSVTQVNDSPTITSTPSTSATEDVQYSYTVIEGDPDDAVFGTGLSISLSNEPTGMVVGASTGIITWTPANGVTTSGLVTVTVTDGGEDGSVAATQQFTVTVTGTNDPPSITSSATTTATEDIQYSYQVLINDIDDSNNGTDITFTLNTEPAGMSVSNTGLVTWTPLEGVATSGAVTVTVEDGNEDGSTPTIGNNGVQSFTVSVTAVNDAPTITSSAVTTATEDVQYSYFVTENDPDDGTYNAGLTISLSNQPTGMVISPTTGEITWTPVNGVTASGLVTVTVTDGGEDGVLPATQQFTVAVTAVNDAPAITSSAIITATEDTPYSYAVVANDIDDTGGFGSGANQLQISLSGAPAGMIVATTTGIITWTPANGVATSGLVTVTVADGGENGASPAAQMFTVGVTAVNDSANITSAAVTTGFEDAAYSYAVVANDIDDTGGFGTGANQLQISLSGEPAGMVVAATTGNITWTPPRTGAQLAYNNISVTVQDGLEDGAVVSQQVFSVTVSIDDTDSDLVAVYADNCPSLANAGQADNDNDTVYVVNAGFPVIGDVNQSDPLTGGDVCDTDDDNDGMPDAFEDMFAFLDPFDSADANADEDGDGLTNLEEYNLDNSGATIATDNVGPDVTAPDDITIDATGLLTVVDIGTATGTDGNEGEVTLFKVALNETVADCNALSSLATGITSFRPGSHTVTWVTCDSGGNLGSDDQIVNVKPLVSMAAGQFIGEGQAVSIDVVLNGDAIAYPATVDYTLSGTAVAGVDHDGVAGTVTFAAKGEVGTIDFNTTSDGMVESNETVTITLIAPFNIALSNAVTHIVTITEANVIPQVSLSVTQPAAVLDINKGNTLYTADGLAAIIANATDGNSDALSYDWSATDANLFAAATITNGQFDFDPSALTVGNFYKVSVTVSDGQSPVTVDRLLLIKTTEVNTWLLGQDDDEDGVDNLAEGYGDEDGDGIPNYLDNLSTPANAIENHTANLETSVLIETDPGLHIALGETAIASGATGVLIGLQDIADHGGSGGSAVTNAATNHTFLSGLLSFEISGLTESIVSVNVVIPLQSGIQVDTVVRKYNSAGWFDFITDDLNTLSSAPGVSGVCPQPGSDLYTADLTAGHLCLQLTIQDGGANDADGMRNFIIKDPSGLALAPEPDEDEAAVAISSSSGRIGSTSFWFMLVFLMYAAYLWRERRLHCTIKNN